ncbi:hypothetical protein ACFXMT_14265 [Streptomyces mirabilis]|uniref:hypothetical protein n=1 Tax=Streptomyces mirabilis TaxID=68239 RepID=UPI0036A08273
MSILIWGLPPDSATRQAINKGKPLWSTTDFLLADLIDCVQYNTFAVANKDVPKKDQSKPPTPYPRPGMDEPKKAKITAAALKAFRERTRRD